ATIGAPLQATHWLFADGSTAGNAHETLAVVNPSADTILRVSVTLLAAGQLTPIDGLQGLEVAPNGRLAIDLRQHLQRPDASVIATTTLPSVVERALVAAPGLSFSMGMPMADSASVPSASVGPTTTSTSTPPPLPASSPPAPATDSSPPN